MTGNDKIGNEITLGYILQIRKEIEDKTITFDEAVREILEKN